MQLKNKIVSPLIVLAAASSPIILSAASSDEVSFKQMKYKESDDRIKIDYSVLDIKKNIGVDYTLNMSFSYDAISGGTPIWDSISGGSSVVTDDTVSGASPCINEQGKYICRDTRSDQILGDGQKDTSDYIYRNVNIEDTRKSGNISLTKRTLSRDEITVGASYSKEEDFKSLEASASYLYNLDSSRNTNITAGVSVQKNSAHFYLDNQWKDFDLYNAQVGLSHTFTKNTVAQVSIFALKQKGELSNPYQTILRKFDVSSNDNAYYKYYRAKEKRPGERKSLGLATSFVSKVGSNISLHGAYRLYKDDWGVLSHTLTLNSYIDITNNWTLMPLFRYYKQKEASFFKDHKAKDLTFNETDYGTSDERLGSYHGLTYGLGLENKLTKDFTWNVNYAYQKQSFDLKMNWVSIGLNYAF